MNNEVFGEVKFDYGWETIINIKFCSKKYSIVVTASAYYDTEAITKEQEGSFSAFINNSTLLLTNAENILYNYLNDSGRTVANIIDILKPRFLIVKRDGEYALLFDDVIEPDNGLAVIFEPVLSVLTQDEWLI